MYHSITFVDKNESSKNSWDDWHLVPSSRPVFNPPKPKTIYVDVPGSNGSLDLSEVVSGEVVYEPRSGSLEFIVMNGYQEWYVLYSEILNYLHGKHVKAILEDEPNYHYEGRFTVNQWKSEPHNSKITIDYVLNPYKLERFSSSEEWLWDAFNFETDYVKNGYSLTVSSTGTMTVYGSEMGVVPTFAVTIDEGSTLTVTFNGKEYPLKNGDNTLIGAKIRLGTNVFTFKGNGYVRLFDYRGGKL